MTTEQVIFEVINLLGLAWLGYFSFMAKRKVVLIEKKIGVTFKNEFDIYKYLWEKAAHFARALKNCFQPGPRPREDDFKMMGALLGPMLRERFEVTETLLNNSPFISDTVRDKAKNLIDSDDMLSNFVSDTCIDYDGFHAAIDIRLDELKMAIREHIKI